MILPQALATVRAACPAGGIFALPPACRRPLDQAHIIPFSLHLSHEGGASSQPAMAEVKRSESKGPPLTRTATAISASALGHDYRVTWYLLYCALWGEPGSARVLREGCACKRLQCPELSPRPSPPPLSQAASCTSPSGASARVGAALGAAPNSQHSRVPLAVTAPPHDDASPHVPPPRAATTSAWREACSPRRASWRASTPTSRAAPSRRTASE